MIPYEVQAYFFLILIAVTLVLIFKEVVRPSVGFLLAVVVLLIFGIILPEDLLAGFSNDKIASIMLLILITSAIRKNFRLELLFDNLFGGTKKYKVFLIRMMGQVAILSSFINNTPVVALMSPYVVEWGKKNKISSSKLLIPLSYAAIMGGMLTIIGTSTTLLLNGFLDEFSIAGLNPFDLLFVGAGSTLVGVLFLAIIAPFLLPDRKDLVEEFEKNTREYIIETHIAGDSHLVGKSVKEGGLRNLKGVYLVEIIRNKEVIYPVSPDNKIEANDQLFFAGSTEQIVELVNSDLGLILPPKITDIQSVESQDIVECVLAENSTLTGKTIKQSDFRHRYDAAVVAIHRAGERLTGRIGDLKLRPGDLLLLYAGHDFSERVDLYRDLYVISSIPKSVGSNRTRFIALSLIVVSIITLLTVGNFSLFSSLLVILAIMVGFKLITLREIKRELDLDLIGILVFSLVLGEGMLKTGTGIFLSEGLMGLLGGFGPLVLLSGIMLFTMLLTSFINNAAAVSIAFPVTYSLIQTLNMDGSPFYLGIAFAASGSFMTPFGYQTNLIIFGPGGYKISDFIKIGLPITIVYFISCLLLILVLYREVLV